MTKDELKLIVVFCQTETYGDPVLSFNGPVRYTKRQMTFSGWGMSLRDVAIFRCPVCGTQRKFAENLLTDGYHEIDL